MTIRVKNLRLRTVVGVHDWEREDRQDVVVNIEMEIDGQRAAWTDDIAETVDYRAMKKRILIAAETWQCHLLETMAQRVLDMVMEDAKVLAATVEVDKPHALRFADSVSVAVSAKRSP